MPVWSKPPPPPPPAPPKHHLTGTDIIWVVLIALVVSLATNVSMGRLYSTSLASLGPLSCPQRSDLVQIECIGIVGRRGDKGYREAVEIAAELKRKHPGLNISHVEIEDAGNMGADQAWTDHIQSLRSSVACEATPKSPLIYTGCGSVKSQLPNGVGDLKALLSRRS